MRLMTMAIPLIGVLSRFEDFSHDLNFLCECGSMGLSFRV